MTLAGIDTRSICRVEQLASAFLWSVHMNHKIADGWAVAALIAAAACWGGATVITKSILITIPPITLLVMQLGVSVLLLWVFVSLSKNFPVNRSRLLPLGLLGWLNPGVSYTLSLIGLTTTTVSISTLLWATEPVLILALAWLLLGEQLTPKLITFSAIALGGVILIGGSTLLGSTGGDFYGSSLILLGVLCCAFYTVLARRFSDMSPLFAVALQQSFALGWALAIWPFELHITGIEALVSLPIADWLRAGASGLLYYALAFWFYLYGLARVNATVAGACLNLIPVFGVGGAFLFLDERLTLTQWLGAGMILLAVYAIFFLPGKAAKSTDGRAAVLPT
ncbi:MAG: DMT family transporter [Caldilinea sp. CFX5]|nr:DMT family transporter [Caldilinea sp. CFX5]